MKFTHRACAALAILASTAACRPDRQPNTWYVLLDGSQNKDTATAQIYRRAWKSIVAELSPGDRLVAIRMQTGITGKAAPFVDVTVPTPSRVANRRRSARDQTALLDQLTEVSLVTKERPSQTTPILETIAAVAHSLVHAKGKRHVVIMSDMLEDADGVKFATQPPQLADVGTFFERWGQGAEQHIWQNTDVYIVFAGKDLGGPETQPIRSFWQQYFAALGARVRSMDAQLPDRSTT